MLNELYETEKCKKINFSICQKNQTTSIHRIPYTMS